MLLISRHKINKKIGGNPDVSPRGFVQKRPPPFVRNRISSLPAAHSFFIYIEIISQHFAAAPNSYDVNKGIDHWVKYGRYVLLSQTRTGLFVQLLRLGYLREFTL